MSVIPLIDNETFVDSRAAFDANGGLSGSIILIQDVEHDQLIDIREANATYDLRIGPEYRYLHSNIKSELHEDGHIILQKSQSVLIQTEETIYLPKKVFGIILTKVSMVQRGVSNDGSKIDPGYNGQLIVTVTNFGKDPVKLKRVEKFCSVVFFRVDGEARPYDKSSKHIRVINNYGVKSNLVVEWIKRHIITISIIHLALTVLLVACVTYLLSLP
jgi:dCTP deaminase